MAINVDVRIQRNIPNLNAEGTALVILKDATITGDKNPIRLTSVRELETELSVTTIVDPDTEVTTITGEQELLEIEYLLRAGVDVLAFKYDVDVDEETPENKLNYIEEKAEFLSDNLLHNFRFIHLADHAYANQAETPIEEELALAVVEKTNAELFLQVGAPETNITEDFDKARVSFFYNFGKVNLGGDKADTIIPAALAVLVRKAIMIRQGTPWVPIAGETAGVINEFVDLTNQIGNVMKNSLQTKGINPTVLKPGIGALITSQNTGLFASSNEADKNGPLARGHIVTLHLAIENQLKGLAEKYLYQLNNSLIWTNVELEATTILAPYKNAGAITSFRVAAGLNKTMTMEDVRAGKLIIDVAYTPVNAIEEIDIRITIIESEGDFTIEIDGGI